MRTVRNGMTRFALLLSIFAFGTLGLGACDDDETATAETEVIASDYAQDTPGRGPVAVAGGPDACGDYRGPGGYPVRIDVVEGVLPCREARRVLKEYYLAPDRNPPAWSCAGEGDRLVECEKPGVGFAGHMYCRVWKRGGKAYCLARFGPP
jgi:hypothetical protein